DGPAVGVGGGQREGPAGQSEAAREVRARDVGLFGRQHHREAAEVLDPAAYCLDDGRGAVTGHRTGVAEGEVHVFVAVDVGHVRAARGVEVDRQVRGGL